MKHLIAQAGTSASNAFGKIEPPDVIAQSYGTLGSGAGLTGFVSRIIVLITIVAGLWALFNILFAGFSVITSSDDSKKISEMSSRITNTFIGLLVMVAAPLIAALIGLFFFGDASFLLNPEIIGAP